MTCPFIPGNGPPWSGTHSGGNRPQPMGASLRPVPALPQSTTGTASRWVEGLCHDRVEARSVRSGRERSPCIAPSFPEPSVSCRSRRASKSRSFSTMGSTASPRRNSLLLSRIFWRSKVIRSWLVAQEMSPEASPRIGQTVTCHKLLKFLGIEDTRFKELEEAGLVLRPACL